MKITAEPRSDQWNADDFIGGSRTFTIAGVTAGKAEQKYDIELVGDPRVWRPPLTVIRLLLAAWGDESDAWVGRRVTLVHDATVTFGKEAVGGVRISHLSHIDRELRVASTVKRGKREAVVIKPLLVDSEQVAKAVAAIRAAETLDALKPIMAYAAKIGIAGEQAIVDAHTQRQTELEEGVA